MRVVRRGKTYKLTVDDDVAEGTYLHQLEIFIVLLCQCSSTFLAVCNCTTKESISENLHSSNTVNVIFSLNQPFCVSVRQCSLFFSFFCLSFQPIPSTLPVSRTNGGRPHTVGVPQHWNGHDDRAPLCIQHPVQLHRSSAEPEVLRTPSIHYLLTCFVLQCREHIPLTGARVHSGQVTSLYLELLLLKCMYRISIKCFSPWSDGIGCQWLSGLLIQADNGTKEVDAVTPWIHALEHCRTA